MYLVFKKTSYNCLGGEKNESLFICYGTEDRLKVHKEIENEGTHVYKLDEKCKVKGMSITAIENYEDGRAVIY